MSGKKNAATRKTAIEEFISNEVAGGILLLAASALALVWANSAWGSAYFALWRLPVGMHRSDALVGMDLHHWINDGLMAVFFFVVGLEIKREIVKGELSTVRRAALPVIAALGGMVVPALIYFSFNREGEASRGWGIPMATDIAFALGVVALLGRRVPPALRLFLLALAIADDLGAILVIAIFYTARVSIVALGAAALLLSILLLIRRLKRTRSAWFLLAAIAFWAAVLKSGVHATIAGVVLGLVMPLAPERGEAESPGEWLEHTLHPWVSFLILPVFALANAGVALDLKQIGDAAASSIGRGVFLGLVTGKIVGVFGFSFVAVKLKIAELAESVRWTHVAGAAMLAGIGFTVSLFITGLAFENEQAATDAKIAILGASVVAGAIGYFYLLIASPEEARP